MAADIFEQYCFLCEQIKIVGQYVEWLEMGGTAVYGSLDIAKRWYRRLLEISGELLD